MGEEEIALAARLQNFGKIYQGDESIGVSAMDAVMPPGWEFWSILSAGFLESGFDRDLDHPISTFTEEFVGIGY